MNKKIFYLLPVALALTAFSAQGFAQEKQDPNCKRKSEVREVNLNLNAQKNKINPECALMNLGETIVFKLTPKSVLKLGNVTIEPANPLDVWLSGSNDRARDYILIPIPGEHDPDKPLSDRKYSTHEYVVRINGKAIDPRIQIER